MSTELINSLKETSARMNLDRQLYVERWTPAGENHLAFEADSTKTSGLLHLNTGTQKLTLQPSLSNGFGERRGFNTRFSRFNEAEISDPILSLPTFVGMNTEKICFTLKMFVSSEIENCTELRCFIGDANTDYIEQAVVELVRTDSHEDEKGARLLSVYPCLSSVWSSDIVAECPFKVDFWCADKLVDDGVLYVYLALTEE
jgi:hypothetical protein